MKTVTTYKFRVKDSSCRKDLRKLAGTVNFVWNYCNEVYKEHVQKKNIWLSGFDLNRLTTGVSRDLGIYGSTVNAVCEEYVKSVRNAKKLRLSWRSAKRSLGWIPFKRPIINGDTVKYLNHEFRFWKSREIEGIIKTAIFSQDARGRWYINIQAEQEITPVKSGGQVGIDLGLKTLATLSNGTEFTRPNLTSKYADRLAMAQRAGKKRLVKTIHAKVSNSRKDWNHKVTTKIINTYDKVYVGNVSSSKLKKTRMAKSVSDAGWSDFKTMLAYKAIALGVEYKEVNESFSTVTCSTCLNRTGPSGLSALGVREWVCASCGTTHIRDVNAAKNILRIGRDTPIKGALCIGDVKSNLTERVLTPYHR